jgi:hypothetical protein
MILVSVPYDGGIAKVYRDDEGTWLDGCLLDQRPGREGIGGGRWAVGGLLPPGASRAIVEGVEAATRGGAWLAVIDAPGMFGEPAVRYEAADGTVVRPPAAGRLGSRVRRRRGRAVPCLRRRGVGARDA